MVGEMRDKETTSHRHRGLAHRPPGVRHAAHQLARRNRSSACSTWAWTRSTSPTRCSASWRSAWPSACAQVQGGLHAATQDEIKRFSRSTATELMNTDTCARRTRRRRYEKRLSSDWVKDFGNDKGRVHALQAGRLRHLRRHRLQGPRRPARAADRHRSDEEADPGARARGRDARARRSRKACAR